MPNEAFALSPISARAASPTDADFDAIREAFLETARGRWFLDEYTRRNRNADTAMVLEAVTRLEQSLAAQKQDQRQEAVAEPDAPVPPSNELPEAMAAVRVILAAARDSAASAVAGPAIEEMFAPSRKCARVIREIAWGLRESGADGRICTLLESQVEAINAACDHAMTGGIHHEVMRAFDEAARKLDEIAPPDAIEMADRIIADEGPAPEFDVVAVHTVVEEAQAVVLDEALFETPAPVADPAPEAVIDTVADDGSLMDEAITPKPLDVRPEPVADVQPDIVMTAPAFEVMDGTVANIAPQSVAEEQAISTLGSTLGASLIASGVIARPAAPRSDPLASIRRMSLAERVAFFS